MAQSSGIQTAIALQRQSAGLGPVFLSCMALTFMAPSGSAQVDNFSVSVDPRIELMSTIFRLAEYGEYNQKRFPEYDRDIAAYFKNHLNHAVVQYARKLRQEKDLGFDGCMAMAVHVSDVQSLRFLGPLDAPGEVLDQRWDATSVRTFLDHARSFVQDTDFAAFLRAQQSRYDHTVQRMEELLKREAHMDWFEKYFGTQAGSSYRVVIGMLNGGANYGPRYVEPNGHEVLYSILGVGTVDRDGMPLFDTQTVDTLVHEFAHSFVNHVVERHRAELEPAGKQLFEAVEEPMRKQAYGNWKTMLDELFVRAVVVRYVRTFQGPHAAEKLILDEEARKFLWIREAEGLLHDYEHDRDRFPTFEAYFPTVVRYFRENGEALANRNR